MGEPSAAQTLPTVEGLQAKIDAATGATLPSSFEQITFTQYGVSGTRTIARSGDDIRITSTVGRLQQSHGSFKAQRWYQNANGQTVIDGSDPSDTSSTAVTATVSRERVPIDAYVISRLNAAGHGTKDYVDPSPIASCVAMNFSATETSTTVYDDFRTVHGFTTAWHWIVRDGHPADDVEYRIDALVARPLEMAELAIPPPRHVLVEFPGDEPTVALPTKLQDRRFIVTVTIDGKDCRFLLDTGTSGILIDDHVARRLGLEAVAHFYDQEDAGRFHGAWVRVPEMRVGSLSMHDVFVATLPHAPDGVGAEAIVGILGFDFIAESLLELDYEHGTVTAMHADMNVASMPPGSTLLNVRFSDGVPLTSMAVNGYVGNSFLVDTGDTVGLIIFDHFARHFPKALVDEIGGLGIGDRDAQLSIRASDHWSALTTIDAEGNHADTRPYRLSKVSLGSVEFDHSPAYRQMPRGVDDGTYDGIIGVDKLRLFDVWLDYLNSRILLVPNAAGRAAMKER